MVVRNYNLKENKNVCDNESVCEKQKEYRMSNMGKFKIKYDGMSYCFFCKCDLRTRMYMNGVVLK